MLAMPFRPIGCDYAMDINNITSSPDHYSHLNVIGNGAYGTVYKAMENKTKAIVAIKKIKVTLTEEGVPMSTLREIATLKMLDQFEHPNIVRLKDICHGQRLEKQLTLYLVFEHLDQDLSKFLELCPPPCVPAVTMKNFLHQILSGIDFLHSHRILHRDLKPQNLLISNNGRIKLGDFGLAKTYDFEMRLTSVVVTLWYRSPEVLLGCPYATPVDVWSIGCIMAEMVKLSPIFQGFSEGDQLDKIFRVIGTPTVDEWPIEVPITLGSFAIYPPQDLKVVLPNICDEGKDLLEKMLKFDPNERISAGDALTHAFFKGINYAIEEVVPEHSTSSDSDSSNELGL